MSDDQKTTKFPVGSRVTIGHDKRTLGTVEAYELGNGVGRPFVRCDDGMGYWCERFQLVSVGMTDKSLTTTVEWGSFSVRQDGMTVAGGTGPYAAIQREAAHYAAVYRQDGAVKVTVRRLKPRNMQNVG